jgi:hypothetical protein
MIDNIPSSMQKLLTLGDIASAQKGVKDEDYFQLKRDYKNLINAVSALLVAINGGEFSPLSGSGDPNGVVAANYSLLYIDTDVNQLHYNPTYGENTGWIAL